MPQEVLGDLQAQAAANDVGGAKLLELMDEYGLDDLASLSETIIDRSEQALRAAVERLPDGEYVHDVQMDGRGDELLTIRATVTVAGSDISVDFAGSSPQVDYGVNGTLNVAFGWAAHAIKSTLVPTLPNNEGFFRPISVDAPEGSIVNARFPAPTSGRHMLFMYLSGAVFGALAQIVPETVVADSGIITIPSLHGRTDDGAEFAYWFMTNNGMGATAAADGYSGTSCPASVPTPSVEIMENVSPLFVERREFVPDSGGPGRHRGGLAQEIVFRVRTRHRALLSCMFERIHSPAQGTRGGDAGAPGYVLLNGAPIDAKGQVWLEATDRIAVSGGGGGGYGVRGERDADAVRSDVADGLVSADAAAEVYGVGEVQA
jgi:N-methylhydantoinase B